MIVLGYVALFVALVVADFAAFMLAHWLTKRRRRRARVARAAMSDLVTRHALDDDREKRGPF